MALIPALFAGIALWAALGSDAAAQAALTSDRMAYVRFQSSPFPYRGIIPDKGIPFLDVNTFFQSGHTAPRAGIVYPENPTYSDRRSLVYFPRGFDLRKPAAIVVYFHGNNTVLERDVVARQGVPRQLAASGINAALVAPQFALDALDSSAGSFWTPGAFSRYLDEAAANLAAVFGDSSKKATFQRLPVILVAYSGGYDGAAFAISVGGSNRRIAGIILLDSPYDYESRFADFITQQRSSAFLFSAYAASAAGNNALLQRQLTARRVPFTVGEPSRLVPGTVAFLAADPTLNHDNFVTQAWVNDPLAWALARIPAYRR